MVPPFLHNIFSKNCSRHTSYKIEVYYQNIQKRTGKTCKTKIQYSFQPLIELVIHLSKISVSSNKERVKIKNYLLKGHRLRHWCFRYCIPILFALYLQTASFKLMVYCLSSSTFTFLTPIFFVSNQDLASALKVAYIFKVSGAQSCLMVAQQFDHVTS